MEDKMSKGILKFCSYFILECKSCNERFTILNACIGNHISVAKKEVAYCPFCGKKSKPKLWTEVKKALRAEIEKTKKR